MARRFFATMAAWMVLGAAAALGADAARVKAFVGARIIDGTGKPAVERGTIVLQDGRIQQVGPAERIRIPAGAERIDVAGKTIVPGLINTHGHVGETQGLRSGPEFYTEENLLRQLGLYARYGVTTVFSLGGDQEQGFRLRDAQDTSTLNRARIYVAGPVDFDQDAAGCLSRGD
jgi:imidazolonepropionase-like amidohydrolase